jgi:ATP-dependent Clp protease ATP-binding subunit ClpA
MTDTPMIGDVVLWRGTLRYVVLGSFVTADDNQDMLQVIDEGRLTDGKGRVINFKNTIIILTSNLGSGIIAGVPEDKPISSVFDKVMDSVKTHFRPEFINRLDEIVYFNYLTQDDVIKIIDLQLKDFDIILLVKISLNSFIFLVYII